MWLENSKRLAYITNNDCNLNCPHCNTGCDKPIGEHPFRQEKWRYKQRDFELTLKRLHAVIPHIRLVGGETTRMNPKQIRKSIDLANKYNIPVSLVTNGYNVMALESHFNKLDYIVLDNHGINQGYIREIKPVIEKQTKTIIIRRFKHYDLEFTIKNCEKTGKTCGTYQQIPAIYKQTLYPCCSPFYYHPELNDAMNDAGWTIKNKNLLETISDLSSLPQEFLDVCKTSCYGNAVNPPKGIWMYWLLRGDVCRQ